MSAELPAAGQPVKVWDGFIRLFHWSLVAIVALNLFVLEEGDVAHRWLGYFAAGAVLARVLWGLSAAGMRALPIGFPWRVCARHVRHAPGRADNHLGHNPLAGLMILTLLSVILGLAVSGWLMGTDAYFGVEWVEELHEALSAGFARFGGGACAGGAADGASCVSPDPGDDHRLQALARLNAAANTRGNGQGRGESMADHGCLPRGQG